MRQRREPLGVFRRLPGLRALLKCCALCCVVLASGCMHRRISMIVDVEDFGPQIETKNRYTLVLDGEYPFEMQENCARTNRNLQKAQPKVFAPGGIPFVLSGNWGMRVPNLDGGSWHTAFLAPLLVLPVMESGAESSSICTIDVLDNPEAHASFTVTAKRDTAFALLSPLPLLCYQGKAGFEHEPERSRRYTVHSIGLMGGDTITEYGDAIDAFGAPPAVKEYAFNSVDAYGIAAMLKRMEDAGQIDASRILSRHGEKRQMAESAASKDFDLIDFRRVGGRGYRYSFVLKSRSARVSLKDSRRMQGELREMVRRDFAASFPQANRAVTVIDFVEYVLADGEIRGAVSVLPLDVRSFAYDRNTRRGRMRIGVEAALLPEAREYCRRNIESIVRDKNIALAAGEIPPAACFEMLDERVEDGVLEIVFKAE